MSTDPRFSQKIHRQHLSREKQKITSISTAEILDQNTKKNGFDKQFEKKAPHYKSVIFWLKKKVKLFVWFQLAFLLPSSISAFEHVVVLLEKKSWRLRTSWDLCALKHMIIRWTTEEPHKTEWRPSRGNKRDEEKEWKGGRMAYCLAAWCPHSAVSCPLVAVDDSLNPTFTPPPARDWWVPTPWLVPPSKDPLTPLPTIWMPGTNNKGCPPVIRGCREKEEKLKTWRSHQILRGL